MRSILDAKAKFNAGTVALYCGAVMTASFM